MVATVKSRSSIAGLTPSGSLTWLMWIESPISRPSSGDVDLVRDVRRVADQLELVLDDVENAAALQARRGFFIVEAHRHRDVHLGVLADAQEIDVDRAAGDRVEIHGLRQRPVSACRRHRS